MTCCLGMVGLYTALDIIALSIAMLRKAVTLNQIALTTHFLTGLLLGYSPMADLLHSPLDLKPL